MKLLTSALLAGILATCSVVAQNVPAGSQFITPEQQAQIIAGGEKHEYQVRRRSGLVVTERCKLAPADDRSFLHSLIPIQSMLAVGDER